MYSARIEDLAHRQAQDDGSVPSLEERQALVDFLDQKVTVEQAALSYTQKVAHSSQKHPDSSDLWSFITDIAQHLPETQDRLIDLLKAIKQLPPLMHDGEIVVDQFGGKYWSDLPGFEFDLREYYDGQWDHSRYDVETRSLLVNLVTFTASLHRHGFFDLSKWAVWNIQQTLEKDYQGAILDAYLASSAQWILQCGADVFKTHTAWLTAGPLLSKAREVSEVGRWDFWRGKFAELSKSEHLGVETKENAKKAARIMEEIRGSLH